MEKIPLDSSRGRTSATFSRLVAAAGLAVVLGDAGPQAAAQVSTFRVSVDSAGAEGNGLTNLIALSGDGRFTVIWGKASNLAPGDTNGTADVFFHDRYSGGTELVSVSLSGVAGNGFSGFGAGISDDGRFVAFYSEADDLVASDTNGQGDVFVRDRLLGTTELVSVDSAENQGNGTVDQGSPGISADGRFVVFVSTSDNLVAGDTNNYADVFLRDRQNGTTKRVSVSSAETEGVWYSDNPEISADGRFVAFDSISDNLVANDTNLNYDVFVRDRQAGTTELVSVDSNGIQGSSGSTFPFISADGRFVAFVSDADNLVPGDTNHQPDIFLRDRQLGTTERVSVDSSGSQSSGASFEMSPVSADGRYVAFWSDAADLVAGDTNATWDVFLRDRVAGTTQRVSVSANGTEGNGISWAPLLSADGRVVGFSSGADNLVAGDTNGVNDGFVRGPWLTLEADPPQPTAGQTLTFTAWSGQPSALNLLSVVDVDGTVLFTPVMNGTFDAVGGWTNAVTVPSGLSGVVVTVQLFGILPTGKVGKSNPVAIAFQ